MQLTTCPSRAQLSDYLSGKLSVQEIDNISLHIETCVDCDTAVNKLDDDSDSLMFALGQPLGEEIFEQEPELQRAVAAMRLSLPESGSPTSCTVLGTVREYDLLEKIGQGGMGTVYKALHSRLKRIVALKVLADHRLGDPAAVDRFSREMQAVGKLAHPNIVRAFDAGEADGRHYLVMEYIDGIDLSRLSRRCGPLPVAEASELVLQVSLALQHAHEHGLVHRDIKPSNVMLTRAGNVKLLDLGIALLQPEEPATSDLTGTGQVMGTLDYMAPEQLDNTHAVDIRADIYGLGATLYKLLCGSAPATDSQSRFRLPGESIPPVPNIRTIRGDIPKPVAAVIQRMLAPHPDQRYATPADVAEALKPFAAKSNLKQLALAAADDAPSRTMMPPKRFGGRMGRFVIAAAALLGIALAGFAIYVETDKGQIVIHSNVDDVQVLVKRTGKLYDALDELEVDKGDNLWKFRSGSYEVQLLGKTDGLRVKDGVFTLTRDGKAVVTIERDPARPKTVVASGPVYEGKTLDEWIELLLMEKSVQQRSKAIPGITVLGNDAPNKAIAALLKVGIENDLSTSHSQEINYLQKQTIQAIQQLSPDQIPLALLDALQDSDVKKRRYAAQFIRHHWNNDPPITVVRTAANDSEEYVRRHAVEWLQRYGPAAIPDLIVAFDDESDKVRRAAVSAVSLMAFKYKTLTPEDARLLEPKIYDMVDDKSAEVREQVLWALSNVASDDPKLLAVLEAALRDPVPKVQVASIDVLRGLGPQAAAAVPALTDALKSLNRKNVAPIITSGGSEMNFTEPIPAGLIRALGSIGPNAKSGVPVIKEFLQHEHKDVRKNAVQAIKQITGEDIELPKDNKTPSNKTAASGPVYDGKTFDEWVALLKTDKSPQRQIEGIKALAALTTDENAERALETILAIGASHAAKYENDSDRQVADTALKAITRIDREQMVRALILEKLNDDDVGLRLFALAVLDYPLVAGRDPKYGDKILSRLFEMAGDPSKLVRTGLTNLLARIGKPSVPTLIQIYQADTDQQVRYVAFSNLASMKGDEARDALPMFLVGILAADGKTRSTAYRGVRELKPDPKQLNEALIKAIESKEEAVRRSAIEFVDFLMRTGRPTSAELLPVLIAGLISKDVNVQHGTRILMPLLIRFPQEVIPTLISELDSAQGETKERIVLALVRYNRSVLALVRHNRSGENGRTEATDIRELERLYQTADANRRTNIIRVFGEIGPGAKSALPLVEKAMKDKDPQVRAAAEAALKKIKSQRDLLAPSQHRSSFESQLAETLTMKITTDGKFEVSGKPYDKDAMQRLLAEQIKQAGERGVAVRIDAAAAVRFEAVNTLIEMCKKAGVRNVSLGTTKVVPAVKNDGAAVFDGKTFNEWLSILKTETNPAKLAPVITAVGTTGARGHEREAAAAILNVAKLTIAPFNESLYSNDDEKKLVEINNAINIALTRIGAPHATGALIEAVNAPHLGMRRHAQQVLYEWTMSEEYADQIFAALKHNDPEMREWAVAQLAKVADSKVRKFDEIIAQLFEIISNDKSIAMRRAAAEELRRLTGNTNTGDRRAQNDGSKARRMKEADGALEQLYSLAKDQDPTVRYCVLWVLTRLEADPATLIPLLADAAGDKKTATHRLVIDELSNLAPRSPAAIAALIASYPQFDADERIRIVHALALKGAIAAPAIPLLKEATKSEDQLLREAAVEALKKLEPSKQ